MDALSLFIQKNKGKIREVSDRNITRNKDSIIVLPKDDEWRYEKEWDELYKNIRREE
ncbi:hypothetical protein [Tissierella sp.]|uniref:hypothetical protein n=1 Tax=Tissierella sp. TaxID=41274 RepID=UPI00304CE46B